MKKQAVSKTHSLLITSYKSYLLATDQAVEGNDGNGIAELLGDLLSILLDGEGAVLDELLLGEHGLLVELLQTANSHLLLDSLGLAGLGSLSHVDLLLVLDGLSRNLIAGSADRGDGGNLKGDVVSEGLEGVGLSGLGLLEGELDEDADLTTHVDVRSESAILGLAGGETGDLHVLAHDVNHLGELRGNGLLAHRLLEQSVDVSRLGGRDNLSDLGSKAGELGVGADEVGLAGELEQSAGLAILGDERGDSALVGLTASLLGSLARPFLRRTSTAASMSPSASTRAFLHSIIGESVISRSCLTIAAVIWAIVVPFKEMKKT